MRPAVVPMGTRGDTGSAGPKGGRNQGQRAAPLKCGDTPAQLHSLVFSYPQFHSPPMCRAVWTTPGFDFAWDFGSALGGANPSSRSSEALPCRRTWGGHSRFREGRGRRISGRLGIRHVANKSAPQRYEVFRSCAGRGTRVKQRGDMSTCACRALHARSFD